MSLTVSIPVLPPGINRTYIYNASTKNRVVLSNEARHWDEKAAHIIGTQAAAQDWQYDKTAKYSLLIEWGGSRHDVDAHVKLAQDCLTRKLGFDDRQIVTVLVTRIKTDEEMINLTLLPHDIYLSLRNKIYG
jgi:Holliday junction resolvase RusA-like endonuclease